MEDDDQIPAQEIYRNCRVHDQQPPERVALVKRELDQIFDIADPQKLFKICGDAAWSPEGRLLAATRLLASWELATEGRMARPEGITIETIKACTAGLDSALWRSPRHYCSDLCDEKRAVPREKEWII
jgi:hypothetical protein